MKKVNIAIDGPAGAGKSSISKEVAKKLGVCRQTIIKWERNTGRLNFEKLQILCRVYGVDMYDIFLG